MNPILLRYAGIALVAAIFGVGGSYLAVNNRAVASPPVTQSGTIPAIPAQPHPGWRVPATPAVPAVPKVNVAAKYKVKVLAPNGREQYAIGKDPVHISWSGGLGNVWLLLMQRAGTEEQNVAPVVDGWIHVKAILSDNSAPSGSFDWDGKYCELVLDLPAIYIKDSGGWGWTWYRTNNCGPIPPGSYKILAISPTDPNVGITYETLDWFLWYAAFDKNSNINFDLSDKPFTIVGQ